MTKRLACVLLLFALGTRAAQVPEQAPPGRTSHPELMSQPEPPPPPPPEPAREALPRAAMPGLWQRRVRLLGDNERVELHRTTSGRDELVCRIPCEALVEFDPKDEFVLDGKDIVRSAPFVLQPTAEDLTLRVSAGSTGSRLLGGSLLAVGGVTFAFAGLNLLVESGFGDGFCDGDPSCAAGNSSRRDTSRTVSLLGLGIALAGGALLIFGGHPTTFTPER